jgi:hypothetical protein
MKEERRSYVRHPLTLFVDSIQFDPEVYSGDVVRTAYDLELTEYDIKKLYDVLDACLKTNPIIPIRIRVIGRLVS